MPRPPFARLFATVAAVLAALVSEAAEARVVIATNAEVTPLAVQLATTVDTTPVVEWERVELRAPTGALWFLVPVDDGDSVAIASETFLATVDRLTAPHLQRRLSPSCENEIAWGTATDPGAPVLLGRSLRIDDESGLGAFFGAEKVTVPAALLGALRGHLRRGGKVEALEAEPGAATGALAVGFRTERRTSEIRLDWVLAGTQAVPVTSFLFAARSAEAGVVHTFDLGTLAHRKSDLRADYLDLVRTTLGREAEDVALLEGASRAKTPIATADGDRDALERTALGQTPWITRLAFAVPPKGRGSALVPRTNANLPHEPAFAHDDAICTGTLPNDPLPPPISYGGGTGTEPAPIAQESGYELDDGSAEAAAACTVIAIESCSSAAGDSGGDDSSSSDDSCSSDKKEGGGDSADDDDDSSDSSDEPIDLGARKKLELTHRRVVKKRSPVSRLAIGACAIVLPLRRRKRRD